MSNVSSDRAKQAVFVSKWWLCPAGYEVVDGQARIFDDQLITSHLPNGDLMLEAVPSDERKHSVYGEKALEWLVARNLDRFTDLGFIADDCRQLIITEPLKVRALHRRFADLDSSESVWLFALANGFMGVSTWRIEVDGKMTWGEPIEDWIREANLLRLLLSLWEGYFNGAPDHELSDLLELDREYRTVSFRSATKFGALPKPSNMPAPFPFSVLPEPFRTESVIRSAARTALIEMARERLGANSVPWFDLGPGGQISLAPKNLLGAVYVHFLQELLGRTDPLFRCASCGKWFVQRHAGRIYCSNACKQKAYRRGLTKTKDTNGK